MQPGYTWRVSHQPAGAAALYKVCSQRSWSQALQTGELPISGADARDGYVHLSAAHQVRGTLERHFAGQPDLVLLVILPSRLPAGALRWEPSRNGELFPHLYAELRAELVLEALALSLDDQQRHSLPQGF